MRALVLALAFILACSHESKPAVQPDDHPPLPPASGTPIGYLIDDAGELRLRDDQLTQLKALDEELSNRLASLDARPRGDRPRAADGSGQAGRHRGRRGGGGGMSGGGMSGGGMSGGGMSGGGGAGRGRGGAARRAGGGSGAGAGSASATTAAADGAANQRATEVRDALRRAFAVLDAQQQAIATRVLSDRGVDLDPDHPGIDPDEPGNGSDN